jgi:hypothetical protein
MPHTRYGSTNTYAIEDNEEHVGMWLLSKSLKFEHIDIKVESWHRCQYPCEHNTIHRGSEVTPFSTGRRNSASVQFLFSSDVRGHPPTIKTSRFIFPHIHRREYNAGENTE